MSKINRSPASLLTPAILALAAGLISISASSTIGHCQTVTVIAEDGTQHEGKLFPISEYSFPWQSGTLGNGQPIFVVDDGLRRVFFNSRIPVNSIKDSDVTYDEYDIYQRVYRAGAPAVFVGPIVASTQFDEYGRRTVTLVEHDGKRKTYVQGITKITPKYVVVSGIQSASKSRHFDMRISINSIPPKVLTKLLHRQIKDKNSVIERERLVAFFIAAGMTEQAAIELEAMQLKFPELGTKDFDGRATLQAAIHRRALNEIRFRFDAKQPVFARKLWEGYKNKGSLPAGILAEFRDLQNRMDGQVKAREDAVKQLQAFAETAQLSSEFDVNETKILLGFIQELEQDLNDENILRLTTFNNALSDTERSLKQKLAIAISGWFLGSSNVVDNFAVAQSLPLTRELIVEYLQTADAARRAEILKELELIETGTPEYIAQIVGNMVPPKPVEGLRTDGPMEFPITIVAPEGKTRDTSYFVQLPPEYDPHRKYPCILTLPTVGRDPKLQLDWWSGQYLPNLDVHSGPASRHGYIVVSPAWYEPGQSEYKYSVSEHDAVLSTYRDAIRRFSIDTDRVFLSGHFRGGDAAWDIGLAHPDLWAGVIPISAVGIKYVFHYFETAKFDNLPFYVLMGEKDPGIRQPDSTTTLNRWLISRNFDLTIVEYRGRGGEHFFEDHAKIFQWMKNKRRKWVPVEFNGRSLRPTDNFFWNLEVAGIPEKHWVSPAIIDIVKKSGRDTFELNVKKTDNRFAVKPMNSGRRFTIWLGPEFVDFSAPIKITGRGSGFNRAVTPRRKIILEDVRRRGDRQHPFWAKLFCDKTRWVELDGDDRPVER